MKEYATIVYGATRPDFLRQATLLQAEGWAIKRVADGGTAGGNNSGALFHKECGAPDTKWEKIADIEDRGDGLTCYPV